MSSTALSFASSVPPVGTELPWCRISPDGRLRSSRGSSDDSEELRGDSWVVEDLRAGGPTLAPVPSTTIPFPPGSPYMCMLDARKELSKSIQAILQQSGVTAATFTLCYRRCVLFLNDHLVPTLLVVAEKKSPDEDWLSVSREIYQLLEANGLSQFNVEICDERVHIQKNSSPVPSSDPIYPLWDDVLEQILNSIDCSFVLAIECFRYGANLDGDKNPPTVIVTVARSSRGPWKDTREAIVSILNRYNLHHVADLPDNAWNNQMQVGLSLGIYQSRHSSFTFGGWIEIKQEEGSAWKRLGLTCYHSVHPDISTASMDDRSIYIQSPIGKRINLEQPSLKDTESVLKDMKEELGQKPPACFTTIKETIEKGGDVSPRSRTLYDEIIAQAAEISDNMARIEYFHRSSSPWQPYDDLLHSHLPINPSMGHFVARETDISIYSPSYAGHVYTASGYRHMVSSIREEKRRADWALIELLTYGSIGRYTNNLDLQPFPGIPEENTQVYKLGRSTRRTKGNFSGLTSALLDTPDNRGGAPEVKSLEYAVTGPSGWLFSGPGDSGALVFDKYANCIGMVISWNTISKVSYVTLLPDLFDDIRQVTGAVDVRIAE
ncbi:uncharacterized protein ARB_02196 [Trichophyton benhamiae CBS 112371]|uniref:Uncharacterized protein n=1 Tax=Arthroderma benhamiae (strain ATCC MYA-4681 / CBS 112371) TaxID=663331 RepID=D4B167_ARTBC|nr:uncharacterized protein ARB_02196 [Trichophyton benhamiae CBS 112371]EFE31002.1 hypothetical protein ARB_02196 [Trichophyton benhamiae CBS 112371]